MDAAKAGTARRPRKRRDPIDELVREEDQPPEDAAAAE
jgi:hypothetical protein